MFVQEKRSIYLAIELSLREISYVLYGHALVRALMAQKLCAVGLCNAIPRNHLNCIKLRLDVIPSPVVCLLSIYFVLSSPLPFSPSFFFLFSLFDLIGAN